MNLDLLIGFTTGFLAAIVLDRLLPDFWLAKRVMLEPWFSVMRTGTHRIVFVASIDYKTLREKILHDPKSDLDHHTPIVQSWMAPDLDPDTRYVLRRLVWPENFIEPGAYTAPPPENQQ